MLEFYNRLNGLEQVYFCAAALGGLFFLLRMLASMFGHGDHGDVDVTVDASDPSLHHVGDSDGSFKLVSVQGLVGFFLMFGLVGLALSRESHVAPGWSVVGAFVAGGLMMVLVAWIAAEMRNLQSSGNVDMKNAVGQQGSVYLSIPADGSGQAQVAVQGRMRIYDAVSKEKTPIKTGERIEVVEVVSGNILVVRKI